MKALKKQQIAKLKSLIIAKVNPTSFSSTTLLAKSLLTLGNSSLSLKRTKNLPLQKA